MKTRLAIAAALCVLVSPFAALAQAPRDAAQAIEITSQAIESFDPREPARSRFGALTFRGGLVLTSPARDFGGLSSLKIEPDGAHFLSLTDRGNWLRGRIVYRGTKPIAIADAEMAPILGPDGKPVRSRRGWYDTESLAADGSTFDKNHQDFDILEAAVTTVLQAKPDSPLAAVADGSQRLTLFAPTDAAFIKLATLLTGEKPASEKKAAAAIVGAVDTDTLEAVLLYHVIPGKTLGSKKVLAAAAEKAELTTAQGGTVGVRPSPKPVRLVDKDPQVKDPKAIVKLLDINKGNKQIAHGIDRVLLPIDI